MGQIDIFMDMWKKNGMWSEQLQQLNWESCSGGMVDFASNRWGYGCFCIHCGKADGPLYHPCSYCNETKFTRGQAEGGGFGLFCLSCHRGWTDWKCKRCDQPNDLFKSLLRRRKLPDEN